MNQELKDIFDEDQKDREDHPNYGTEKYRQLRERDSLRRERVTEIIQTETMLTSRDCYHAAMIFQHGETVGEIWQAHVLAKRAAKQGFRPARYLVASSYDRWLMYQGKPQKYGTNMVPDGKRYRVWDVDPETTDEERADLDVPPLAELHRKAEELTKTEAIPSLDDAPEWIKEALNRWKEEEN